MIKNIGIFCLLSILSIPAIAQNNVMSLHVQPLAIGEIRLGFERTLTTNTSFVLNAGYVIKNEIPKFIYEPPTIAIDGVEVVSKNSISGYSAVAELRRYFGRKESPGGFYIGGYLKMATYSFEMMDVINYTFTGEEIEDLDPEVQEQLEGQSLDINVELDAKINQLGVGIQLGYQIILGGRWTVDIMALGGEIDQMNLEARLVSPTIPVDYNRWSDEVQIASDSWQEYPFKADVEVESIDNGINLVADGILPWYRGGIKIGFAF